MICQVVQTQKDLVKGLGWLTPKDEPLECGARSAQEVQARLDGGIDRGQQLLVVKPRITIEQVVHLTQCRTHLS